MGAGAVRSESENLGGSFVVKRNSQINRGSFSGEASTSNRRLPRLSLCLRSAVTLRNVQTLPKQPCPGH